MIVYSCLFGGYDPIPSVPVIEPGVDYILFTDEREVPEPWEAIRLAGNGGPPRRFSRIPKIQTHWLPNHDVSVYMDANCRLTGKPLLSLVEEALKHADIALPPHAERAVPWQKFSPHCTYGEAEVCSRARLDYPDTIQSQMARYAEAGFPREFGLGENCFIIRRNTPAIRKLNVFWWQEYCNGSQRDQLSLMYSLWATETPFHLIPMDARNNVYYTWHEHLKSRVIAA